MPTRVGSNPRMLGSIKLGDGPDDQVYFCGARKG